MKKLILIATAFAAALALPNNHASAGEEKTIVGVAAGAGQFNTLVAAVKAAGLVDTLNGAGPFTVFVAKGLMEANDFANEESERQKTIARDDQVQK